MTRLLRLTAVFALTAPLLFAAGCKQGVGERCQVQSDCDDGLLCVLPAGGTPQAGGTCMAPNSGTIFDLAMPSTDMAGQPPADLSNTSQSD
jgi:hypothetical protein